MILSSLNFMHEGAIPSEFTCDGQNISPALLILDVSKNAKSLALIMDDPDASRGTFDHWVVFNIPPTTARIEKGSEPKGSQGMTHFRRLGYGGPCPPRGTHRYFFRLYALDCLLPLTEGATKEDVMMAMQSHIIATSELMGTYARPLH